MLANVGYGASKARGGIWRAAEAAEEKERRERSLCKLVTLNEQNTTL